MQSACLTSVSVDPVDGAVLLPWAVVVDHRVLRPPEETFAPFTSDDTVVDTARLVAANLARNYLDLG